MRKTVIVTAGQFVLDTRKYMDNFIMFNVHFQVCWVFIDYTLILLKKVMTFKIQITMSCFFFVIRK